VARKAQNLNFSEPDARSVPGELVLIEAGSGRGFLTRPASVNAGRIGSGGVALRASTLLPLGCNLLLNHAPTQTMASPQAVAAFRVQAFWGEKGDSHQIWRTQRVKVNVVSLRLFLRSSTEPNRAFEPQSLGRVRDPVRINTVELAVKCWQTVG